MTKQSPSHNVLQGALMFEDILGKDIYDQTGAYVGVTNNVYIHPTEMEILALAVDKGFVSKGLVLGTDYIQQVKKHAIFLNTRPVFSLKGMAVYDANGAKVGTVKDLELQEGKNQIESITVGSILRKRKISHEHIKSVEDSIFLNCAKEELQ